MKKQLVLHIGAPKTGTSAIQVFLANNLLLLENCGCYYPINKEVAKAQKGLVTSGNGLELARLLGKSSPYRALLWLDNFFRTVSNRPYTNTILFSSEFFWLAKLDSLRELQKTAQRAGYKVKVIAYVRAQDGYTVSMYSQFLRRHSCDQTL